MALNDSESCQSRNVLVPHYRKPYTSDCWGKKCTFSQYFDSFLRDCSKHVLLQLSVGKEISCSITVFFLFENLLWNLIYKIISVTNFNDFMCRLLVKISRLGTTIEVCIVHFMRLCHFVKHCVAKHLIRTGTSVVYLSWQILLCIP